MEHQLAEPDNVKVEQIGGVCVITLARPERRNAVDGPMGVELRQAFERFEADPRARVAILTGQGEHFCAGADLKSVGDPQRRAALDGSGAGPGPMGPTRMMLSKPLIAAIEGYAVAGGLELALLADMRVAAHSAVLGVFCRRWGVPLIDGGTVRLPRIVGMGRALDLIMTGRPVKADEALAMGLVNRVVPQGQALEASLELAQQILSFPQECMLADRRSAYEQWNLELAEALRNEGRIGTPMVLAEGVHGASRFAQGAGRHGSFDAPEAA